MGAMEGIPGIEDMGMLLLVGDREVGAVEEAASCSLVMGLE